MHRHRDEGHLLWECITGGRGGLVEEAITQLPRRSEGQQAFQTDETETKVQRQETAWHVWESCEQYLLVKLMYMAKDMTEDGDESQIMKKTDELLRLCLQ